MYIYVYLFFSITIKYLIVFILTQYNVYGGQWNGCNVYENYLVAEILVDVRISFNCLVGLIYEEIQFDGLV